MLLGRSGQRKQFGPAVGDPSAFIKKIRPAKRHLVLGHLVFLKLGDELAQSVCNDLHLGRDRQGRIVRNRCSATAPQAKMASLGARELESAGARAAKVDQARHRGVPALDARHGAVRGQHFLDVGLADFAAAEQCDHPEATGLGDAFLDQIKIANFENT